MSTTLIVPGLHSSGPTHWQTWLQHRVAGSVRVTQRNWNDPHLPEWSARIRREIVRAQGSIFVAAHSFGVLAAVQAASDHAERISGVLLVAPADPEHFGVADFLPAKRLAFPTIVVASSNDPWMSAEAAERWSRFWGADYLNLGAAGHINADAGFGPWPEALTLLERLRKAAEFRRSSERLAALSLLQSRFQTKHLLARRPYGFRRREGSSVNVRDLGGAAAVLRAAGRAEYGPDSDIIGGKIATPL
ncbi:alpha/beta hydrolase [Hyphomicrobium sp. B1]|uniref:RBBP9/YdeN family alpha/beta hydrolase n=1 Tax=unclassified Hyphomicrobium TaxID=2619925 RepID=UPI00391B53D9